jgi:hypothetical protein
MTIAMNHPLADITAAIVEALRGSPLIAGGRIVNALPEKPTYPVVRVVTRGRPVGHLADSKVWECESEVDVYSERNGDRECLEIADAVMGVLGTRLIVSGWAIPVQSVLDCYPIPDDIVNDTPVKHWTIPVLVRAVRA